MAAFFRNKYLQVADSHWSFWSHRELQTAAQNEGQTTYAFLYGYRMVDFCASVDHNSQDNSVATAIHTYWIFCYIFDAGKRGK